MKLHVAMISIALALTIVSCKKRSEGGSEVSGESVSTNVSAVQGARFCPLPIEFQLKAEHLDRPINAWDMLRYRAPFKISIADHQISEKLPTSMANPISKLEMQPLGSDVFVAIDLPKEVNPKGEWTTFESGGGARTVGFEVPFEYKTVKYRLRFEISQSRQTSSSPIEPVGADLSWYSVTLLANEIYQPMSWTEGTRGCDQYAYQGRQPGTRFAGHTNEEGRAPRMLVLPLNPYKESPLTIRLRGRSGIGGVDKTMFMQVDDFEIKGLLDKPLSIRNSNHAMFLPAHHNWGDTTIGDFRQALGLSDDDKSALNKKGVAYVVIRPLKQDEFKDVEDPIRSKLAQVMSFDEKFENGKILATVSYDQWMWRN